MAPFRKPELPETIPLQGSMLPFFRLSQLVIMPKIPVCRLISVAHGEYILKF